MIAQATGVILRQAAAEARAWQPTLIFGGANVTDRSPHSSLWTAERYKRLIEMHRTEHTLEEMARELSLPIDEIERYVRLLALEDTAHRDS